MNDSTEHNGKNGRKRVTPRGQRLPQASLDEITELVAAMQGLSGPASRNLVFSQTGKSGSGGAADARWAAIGYYGFRRATSGGKHEITERGSALVSGDDATELEAKQNALVDTGFRSVIKRFSARPVNESGIAGVMQEDLGVPEINAKKLAKMLIAVATDARFIVNGSFDPAPIERALEAVPEVGPSPDSSSVESQVRVSSPARSATPAPRRDRLAGAPPPARDKLVEQQEGKAAPFGVGLEIKIEAQHHTPEEIGQILRQVREALATAV